GPVSEWNRLVSDDSVGKRSVPLFLGDAAKLIQNLVIVEGGDLRVQLEDTLFITILDIDAREVVVGVVIKVAAVAQPGGQLARSFAEHLIERVVGIEGVMPAWIDDADRVADEVVFERSRESQ